MGTETRKKHQNNGVIEFVPLQRDQGAVCYLPDLIHTVNKLQNWVSGKVSQISTEPPTVGSPADPQPEYKQP